MNKAFIYLQPTFTYDENFYEKVFEILIGEMYLRVMIFSSIF